MPEEFEPVPEGEELTGVVVVRHKPVRTAFARYALVKAADWCSGDADLKVWKGPGKRSVTVQRDQVQEITCRTVLVDERGYFTCKEAEFFQPYPCVQTLEDLRDAVRSETEKILNERANELAAMSYSYADAERAQEKYDTHDVMVIARFGDAVAMNGELTVGRRAWAPRGWVETDLGGSIGNSEEEIDRDALVEVLEDTVSEKIGQRVSQELIDDALDEEFFRGRNYIMWTSDEGDVEVWIPRSVLREYERGEEERERQTEAERQRQYLEERRRQEEAHREELRRHLRTWSPRLLRRPPERPESTRPSGPEMGASRRDLARDFVEGATSGRASSMYIEGDRIYSYGPHFPIAQRRPDGTVIMTDRPSPSVTTSIHITFVRRAAVAAGVPVEIGELLTAEERAQREEMRRHMRTWSPRLLRRPETER